MRWLIAILFAGMCFVGGVDRATAASDTRMVHLMPEVRLRKIHLVRPDLIPYPISYEIYC